MSVNRNNYTVYGVTLNWNIVSTSRVLCGYIAHLVCCVGVQLGLTLRREMALTTVMAIGVNRGRRLGSTLC